MEWFVEANTISEWIKEPNIGFSQVGYTSAQQKRSVIELDKNDIPLETATVYQITEDGKSTPVFSGKTEKWGRYLRYNYLLFDFSEVKEDGVYYIEYNGNKLMLFLSLMMYMMVFGIPQWIFASIQMDHMTVNEGYRVWHGNPHQDDALQALLIIII